MTNRFFKRIRDYADVYNKGKVTLEITLKTLKGLNVDEEGLDDRDRAYLTAIIDQFYGGPVGVDNLASCLSEDRMTLENVYEPYLIKSGYIQRTARGRTATTKAYRHLKKGLYSTDENR